MASGKVCLLAVLCSILILTTFTGSAQSARCCWRYVRRHLPCARILSYSIQTINTSCDINAIIFHVPGKFLCADPSAIWTKKRMECIANRFRKMAQIEDRTQGNTTSV